MLRGYQGVLGVLWGEFLCQKRLMLSGEVDECKPLPTRGDWRDQSASRGLHSSTLQLNVSTLCPTWWGALLVSVTNTAQVEQRCGRV